MGLYVVQMTSQAGIHALRGGPDDGSQVMHLQECSIVLGNDATFVPQGVAKKGAGAQKTELAVRLNVPGPTGSFAAHPLMGCDRDPPGTRLS